MQEFMEFVTIDKWTILFTWVNLVILYNIMKKLLFSPVKAVIDARDKEISDLYANAEKAKSDAESMRAQYTQKLSDAKTEAENVVKTARKRAALDEEKILMEAKDKASKMVERAHEQIELDKQSAVNEIKGEIAQMAVGIASKVIERDVAENDHRRLIDNFINDLGDGDE